MDIRENYERNIGRNILTGLNWILRGDIKRNMILASKNRLWLGTMYKAIPLRRRIVAGCYTTGAEAIAKIGESQIGLLLCTIDLEDGDGIGDLILSQAKQLQPTLRCALIVDHDRYTQAEAARWKTPVIIASRDLGEKEPAWNMAQLAAIANTSYRSKSVPPYNPTPAEDATLKLSKRELEMLECYALGLTNAQAAARLNLSPQSTKTYSRNLLSKLNTSNRQLALRKATEQGLIKPTW